MLLDATYVKTSLSEDETALISCHYISEVLPETKQYKEFHLNRLMSIVDNPIKPLDVKFATSKKANERQIEDTFIRPILEALGNTIKPQVPLGVDAVDFCVYKENASIQPDGYASDYSNTTTIIESKRYGRIENKYFIRKNDNTDEVFQTLNYLRAMNLTLEHNKDSHRVSFAVLTDGYKWRIYSKDYIYNPKEYEIRFIEFDLEAIVNCKDVEKRNKLLKLFGLFFSKESLAGELLQHQKASGELQTAVTVALKEQTYTGLEYIATGLWRLIAVEKNPLLISILRNDYNIDTIKALNDDEERSRLLKLIYDESIIYLLRLLFVLYAEDRNLFNVQEIPKVIKGEGNILDLIVSKNKGIGEIVDSDGLNGNYDLRLADVFREIDNKYNGGLFSGEKHPLLYGLNINDTLFANAIDNICRVQIKKKVYTVDFSAVSIRELGGIYESLLEYKLAIMDRDVKELPSIINKKRVRHNVAKGDLYLINHNGERKATGSYYTPDLIVEHLINTSLVPKLNEIKVQHKDDFGAFFKAILDIKVCDPAMGSGHMIQAAYARIINFIQQCVEEMYADKKINFTWNSSFSYQVRTQVARKCIYGADLNPVAVDLAKLVLWMKVFRNDKPFEFFDYNLVCGNSLIGVYEESKLNTDPLGAALFRSQEQVEEDIQTRLLNNVSHMVDMPRNTVEEIHMVESFWKEEVRPLQKQVSFFYNIKLAQWLLPEYKDIVQDGYTALIQGIDSDKTFVSRIVQNDASIPSAVRKLADVDKKIQEEFMPLHWRVAYPHIALNGGFSVILSNPPWDKVKANHNEFFSDYISGYADMETAPAKKLAGELMEKNPAVKKKWNAYNQSIDTQNMFYQQAYQYQVMTDSNKKITFKGDPNLYKVFFEKIYTILQTGGTCGLVIPDNINIDNGCAGLRHLMLEKTTIKELIMFENRKKLFDIHGQYKFDVLTFSKEKPRFNQTFDAGFYWYDPIWLDGTPTKEYIDLDNKNSKEHHNLFRYPIQLIKKLNPNTLIIFEFQNIKLIGIFKKILNFPAIGEKDNIVYLDSFREFDMTNDSDLFNTEGHGWPLFQGQTIHHFSITKAPVKKFVISQQGEERLAHKWKKDITKLPDRTYRIAWRNVAQPTDSRSLICTIVPKGAFCGNSLSEAEILVNGKVTDDYSIISGINVIMSSFCADFYVRQRIAKNVSAFILKSLPLPGNLDDISCLGKMAMPLYKEDALDDFRADSKPMTNEKERNKLIAKLDAKVALLYGLSYEEYQYLLSTFPLISNILKESCLRAFNDWVFTQQNYTEPVEMAKVAEDKEI